MDPKSIDGLKKHSDKFVDEKPLKSCKIYILKKKSYLSLALEVLELQIISVWGSITE